MDVINNDYVWHFLLNIAAFSKFSALQELELPLNNIHNTIKIQPDIFTSLMTLDLSYNRLTGDDILALGLLMNLRTLHLTGKSRGMLNGKFGFQQWTLRVKNWDFQSKHLLWNSQNQEHQKYFLNIIVLQGEGQSGWKNFKCQKQQW